MNESCLHQESLSLSLGCCSDSTAAARFSVSLFKAHRCAHGYARDQYETSHDTCHLLF